MTNYPKDYNRTPAKDRGPVDLTVWPKELRWAYWAFVVAAVIMVVSGLAGFFYQADNLPADVAGFLNSNRLFLSWSNIIGAVIIAVFAPQLSRPMKHARSVLAAVVGLSCFFNIAAIAIGVGGLSLIGIVVALLAGTYLMYRPVPNEYVRENTRYRL